MPTPVESGNEFLVNSTTLNGQYDPRITALSDGRFVMAWQDSSQTGSDTSGSAIRARVFNADGSPAGNDFVVNSTAINDQYNPRITALSDGRFVVAWSDSSQTVSDTSGWANRGRVFNADGSPAGNDFVVNSTTINDQYDPTITALSDGRFAVAWKDSSQAGSDTSGSTIRARVFNADGSPAANDFVVNSTTINDQYNARITALSDGRFVVAWNDSSRTGSDTSDWAIRGRVFNSDGSPAGNDFVVNSTTINGQFDPTITALSDGRFAVAWKDSSQAGSDTSGSAIRARLFNADGSPAGNDFVVNSTTINDQTNPTITALSDGRFVVAWGDNSQTGGDTFGGIRGRVFNADESPAGNDFMVNSTTLNDQTNPTITALFDGRFVVAWGDSSQTGGDTSGSGIRAQIFDAGGAVTPALTDTKDIFASEGKLAFLSQLALSAYHLGDWEVDKPLVNDDNTYADSAFNGGILIDGNDFLPVANHLKLLTPTELRGLRLINNPFLGSTDSDGIDHGLDGIADDFPKFGLKDGIYTNENAAALVGRSADAIFLAFRGTNDNATSTKGPLAQDTPDKAHWWGLDGMGVHYALFHDLISALQAYVVRVNTDGDLTNDVTKLYVTGHSLGASMVQAFLEEWTVAKLASGWGGIFAEAVTFASPGYGVADGFGEDRLSNFWNVRDPILDASFWQDNDGFETTIVHNLWEGGYIKDGSSIHSMALYNGFVQFLQRNGLYQNDLVSANDAGQRFSSIHANVRVIDELHQLYDIGGAADSGMGALRGDGYSNLMLGGAKDDELFGYGGTDRLLGGTDWDKLYGGTGSDTLDGGFGYDEMTGGWGKDSFVFHNYKETNSQNTGDTVDLIMDFGTGLLGADVIDLSGIDARWNRPGDQIFAFVATGAFSGKSGELRFEQAASQTVLMGDCNGDGVADFSIRLAGQVTLAEASFTL